MNEEYYIDLNTYPPICLPKSIKRLDLIDITCVGDKWRKYTEQRTGHIYDCADYWSELDDPLIKKLYDLPSSVFNSVK